VTAATKPKFVMPALVAGIHVFPSRGNVQDVDGRDKPGHDETRNTVIPGREQSERARNP
jgi:hypothetical protein